MNSTPTNHPGQQARSRTILKAINRHIRTKGLMRGGRTFGVDYITWSILHPQLTQTFTEHATLLTGRPGHYLPRACLE